MAQTTIKKERNTTKGFLRAVMAPSAVVKERTGGAGSDRAFDPIPDTAGAANSRGKDKNRSCKQVAEKCYNGAETKPW